jgi:hypothetical protein
MTRCRRFHPSVVIKNPSLRLVTAYALTRPLYMNMCDSGKKELPAGRNAEHGLAAGSFGSFYRKYRHYFELFAEVWAAPGVGGCHLFRKAATFR